MNRQTAILAGWSIALLAACGVPAEAARAPAPEAASPEAPSTVRLAAGEDFAATLQAALIEAQPGQTIEMPAGTFNLVDGLSLDVDGVHLKGAGQDETILNFKGQTGAGEGLLVTSNDVILSDFSVQDTAGDGIKSKNADRITYRDLTVEWTRGPHEENGAYAIYPVESEDVLVERVTVRACSDAGIYVGQSNNIIVRDSLAEYNVAGIEIENSSNADVYGNRAVNNAGGILVFDLPDLPVMGGNSTRIFDNEIISNNTENFAPPGGIVADLISGSGLTIMANRNVHVFNNRFEDNKSVHIVVAGYTRPTEDTAYSPIPDDIVIRDNTYVGGGDAPEEIFALLGEAIGTPLPEVIWDGATAYGDREPVDVNLVVDEDESVRFVSLNAGTAPIDPAAIDPGFERPDGTPVDEPAPIVLPQDKGA